MDILHLDNPNKETLQQQYRQLKRFEKITLYCDTDKLNTTLQDCETIGFIALTIALPKLQNKLIEITCTKAKNGPCYDEGQKASYLGSSIAVLDDDAHLLFPHIYTPVCLKTKEIYTSNYYLGKISIKNNPNFKPSEFGPLPFDCDDFDSAIQKLMTSDLKEINTDKHQTIFYPGPFKAIFTSCGFLIRRGQWVKVPKELANNLCREEGAIQENHPSEPAPKFKAFIQEHGAPALLNLPILNRKIESNSSFNIHSLKGISESLKLKLLHCIEIDSDNFILTGSDPQNEFGCCPSEDVGHANQLVHSGILDRLSHDNHQDQCPIQLYTFKDEASISGETYHYKKNTTLRSLIQQNLEPSLSTKLMRWGLISFIIFSIAFSLFKITNLKQTGAQKQFNDIVTENNIQKDGFVLFHLSKRCEMCLKMENLTKAFCEKNKLPFVLINMDDPHWNQIVNSNQLFAASLFYLEHNQNRELKITLIKEAWEQWTQPESYTEMLSKTIHE